MSEMDIARVDEVWHEARRQADPWKYFFTAVYFEQA
jgi:hypothetical protein